MECYIHCYVELLYLTVILLYLDMIIRYDYIQNILSAPMFDLT